MSRPSLHYQQQPACDADDLIRRYGISAFGSPYRSTIPLLALIRDSGPALELLLAALGVDAHPEFVFEHQVKTRGGRGKPSHTDLMIASGERAWAVEAKWTERRYRTLKQWLGECARPGTSGNEARRRRENREAVANGWLEYIRARGIAAPDLEACDQVVYQMLHRAAAACASGHKPALVYLVFTCSAAELSRVDTCAKDLEALRALLGHPAAFPFYLARVPIGKTEAFDGIKDLPKKTPATAAAVLQALSTRRLFTFAQPEVYRIDP